MKAKHHFVVAGLLAVAVLISATICAQFVRESQVRHATDFGSSAQGSNAASLLTGEESSPLERVPLVDHQEFEFVLRLETADGPAAAGAQLQIISLDGVIKFHGESTIDGLVGPITLLDDRVLLLAEAESAHNYWSKAEAVELQPDGHQVLIVLQRSRPGLHVLVRDDEETLCAVSVSLASQHSRIETTTDASGIARFLEPDAGEAALIIGPILQPFLRTEVSILDGKSMFVVVVLTGVTVQLNLTGESLIEDKSPVRITFEPASNAGDSLMRIWSLPPEGSATAHYVQPGDYLFKVNCPSAFAPVSDDSKYSPSVIPVRVQNTNLLVSCTLVAAARAHVRILDQEGKNLTSSAALWVTLDSGHSLQDPTTSFTWVPRRSENISIPSGAIILSAECSGIGYGESPCFSNPGDEVEISIVLSAKYVPLVLDLSPLRATDIQCIEVYNNAGRLVRKWWPERSNVTIGGSWGEISDGELRDGDESSSVLTLGFLLLGEYKVLFFFNDEGRREVSLNHHGTKIMLPNLRGE